MSKLFWVVSFNLIIACVTHPIEASPLDAYTDEPTKAGDAWPQKPLDENLSVAQPPEMTTPLTKGDPAYYPFHQTLTVRAGATSDLGSTHFNGKVIGFAYSLPRFLSPRFEAGADIQDNGVGDVQAGWRWQVLERSYFRPSYRLGANLQANSAQGLGTFGYINNYYFVAAGALEYVCWNPYSVRIEYEVLLGLADSRQNVTLGLTRGW